MSSPIKLVAVLLSAFLVALPLIPLHADDNQVPGDFIEVYRKILEAHRRGIYVDDLVNRAAEALELYEGGNTEEAYEILSNVSSRLDALLAAPSPQPLLAAVKYVAVAGILSVPIAFYFAFPRLYLRVWFRYRRRWVVKK